MINRLQALVAKHGGINAEALREGLSINANLIPVDGWKRLDAEVVRVQEETMAGMIDLQSRGLITPLGGLGVLTAEWERLSAMTDANVGMTGVSGEADILTFTRSGVPVPIIWKDYEVELRRLLASQRGGADIGVAGVREATRIVSEKIETGIFHGLSVTNEDAYTSYGYINHPQTTSINLTYAWEVAGTDGSEILIDVLALLQAAYTKRLPGPFVLYYPQPYRAAMLKDVATDNKQSVLSYIMQNYPDIAACRYAPKLTVNGSSKNQVCLVNMTSDYVEYGEALSVTNFPWETKGGWVQYNKVAGSGALMIKVKDNGSGTAVNGVVKGIAP